MKKNQHDFTFSSIAVPTPASRLPLRYSSKTLRFTSHQISPVNFDLLNALLLPYSKRSLDAIKWNRGLVILDSTALHQGCTGSRNKLRSYKSITDAGPRGFPTAFQSLGLHFPLDCLSKNGLRLFVCWLRANLFLLADVLAVSPPPHQYQSR